MSDLNIPPGDFMRLVIIGGPKDGQKINLFVPHSLPRFHLRDIDGATYWCDYTTKELTFQPRIELAD